MNHPSVIQQAETISEDLEARLVKIQKSRRNLIVFTAIASGILMFVGIYTANSILNMVLVGILALFIMSLALYVSTGMVKKKEAIKDRLGIINKHLTTDT